MNLAKCSSGSFSLWEKYISSFSENITEGAYITGVGFSLMGAPQYGIPIIAGGGAVSTVLDATGTGLTLIDWVINGSSERADRLGSAAFNLATGYVIGKGLEKSTETIGKMVQELLKFNIIVPIL